MHDGELMRRSGLKLAQPIFRDERLADLEMPARARHADF
jgi:hypothetical protein